MNMRAAHREDNGTAQNVTGARHVHSTFERIATRYDLLNHLLSLNTDKRWRRYVANVLSQKIDAGSSRILDVACGTADLSIDLHRAGFEVVRGLDFCRPMLKVGSRKIKAEGLSIDLIEGDALRLPFQDQSFDAVTIAFGLRNLENRELGLRELRRVLKSGGYLAILEFSKPVIPGLRELFGIYFNHVLPAIGGLISGSRAAYEYLPDSVSRFPDQLRLSEMMREAGFEQVEYKNLSAGIAALHLGRRQM
jgi:demethylmenaquinone methyltransferase / 2-methoxy-6-polyprenyl-1,4-benzoquinol methylase